MLLEVGHAWPEKVVETEEMAASDGVTRGGIAAPARCLTEVTDDEPQLVRRLRCADLYGTNVGSTAGSGNLSPEIVKELLMDGRWINVGGSLLDKRWLLEGIGHTHGQGKGQGIPKLF
ncbi:hypothetical protein SESBI_38105 [Sesbania bispinosa]|nr:hypothetical protein SESBI_38105 [Sesbania bispinosa]